MKRRILLLFFSYLAIGSCAKQTIHHTEIFKLNTETGIIDRVQVEIYDRGLFECTSHDQGLFQTSVPGFRPFEKIIYRFIVRNRVSKRSFKIADPYAEQLDASKARWSIRFAKKHANEGIAHTESLTSSKYALKSLDQLIIYELNPREFVTPHTTFASQTIPAKPGQLGRVFRAIRKKIESGYFNTLGINTIQLMPVLSQGWVRCAANETCTSKRTPWGYQALSWYAINGDFGSARDLKLLIKSAHRHRLNVLADFSIDHGYGGTFNSNITALFPTWKKKVTKNPWGLLELDFENAQTKQYAYSALKRFFTDFKFDGIRFDWTTNLENHHWRSLLKKLRHDIPRKLWLISENPNEALVKDGTFDADWDFSFQWFAPLMLRQYYNPYDGYAKHKVSCQDKLLENISAQNYQPNEKKRFVQRSIQKAPRSIRYLESHDLPRVARNNVRWQHGGDQFLDLDGDGKTPDWVGQGSKKASRLGALLLFTLPGPIMIQAGQEWGANDNLTWRYDPLDWKNADLELLKTYTTLIHLRNEYPSLRQGALRVLKNDPNHHLIAYQRFPFIVILNFSSRPQKINLQLNGKHRYTELMSNKIYRTTNKGELSATIDKQSGLLLRDENPKPAHRESDLRSSSRLEEPQTPEFTLVNEDFGVTKTKKSDARRFPERRFKPAR